jgi:hypothetical protein
MSRALLLGSKVKWHSVLALDSVSLFAIVLLIPVNSISVYPSPSCFCTLGFGGLVTTAAAAFFGAAGRGTA